jgi:hypothetical protein
MKSWIRAAAAFVTIAAAGTSHAVAEEAKGWFADAWDNVARTYDDGKAELYVPIYTWHLPFAYTREKINQYDNLPWGLGYGHGRIDDKGNWHGVYAVGFKDSHFKPEWMVGYGWKTFWPMGDETKLGLGFTAGLTTRSDYGHYSPVPYILPVGSIERGRLSLNAAYVPGGKGNGNVVFFFTQWRFDANAQP